MCRFAHFTNAGGGRSDRKACVAPSFIHAYPQEHFDSRFSVLNLYTEHSTNTAAYRTTARRQLYCRIMQEAPLNNKNGKNMAVILGAQIAPKFATGQIGVQTYQPPRSWRARRNPAPSLQTCLARKLKIICKTRSSVGVVPYQMLPHAF
jgi:hypothetical protein